MFAAQSAKGGAMTKELKRHLEHQSIQAAKAAEELAKKQTKIRLNIHAKGASDLIAVDNRQFSMTSDPYLVGQILFGPLGEYLKRRRSNVAVIIVKVIFISLFFFYCLL